MSNLLTLFPLVLGALLFVSGCSNRATATLSPGADLSTVKTFYVVLRSAYGESCSRINGRWFVKRF